MKKMIFLVFLFFGVSTHADIGFQKGNEVSIANLSGYLTARCWNSSTGSVTSYFNCSGYIASPDYYDYFVHPPLDADKVVLKATHSNGTTRTLNLAFDGEKGITKRKINLAVSTVLQRPLIGFGTNTVEFELFKDGKKVEKGSFVATKKVIEERRCRSKLLYFNDDFYCRNQFQACDAYFENQNFCQ